MLDTEHLRGINKVKSNRKQCVLLLRFIEETYVGAYLIFAVLFYCIYTGRLLSSRYLIQSCYQPIKGSYPAT